MGNRLEGSSEVAVRGWHGRDEGGRFREHPGEQEAPGRVDDAERTDDLVGCVLRIENKMASVSLHNSNLPAH